MSLHNELTPESESRVVPQILVRETKCTTLLHRMTYGSRTEYTANLYKGCTHGCTYCYALSLVHDERKWGSYVDAKVNAPQTLERELMGLKKDVVFLSSASDPYQPVEAKYGITRGCLEVLERHDFPVTILTRSPLVLRDLDIIKRLRWVKVGISVTTVPVRKLEPGVPSLQRRIETLRKLGQAGVRTWVSFAPVIPGLMMVDLDKVFEEFGRVGVSEVSFGVLRFSGYEASREMFEKSAGVGFAEALAGREDTVKKLSDLVRKHGMEHNDAADWKDEPGETTLDTYCR